MRRFVLFSLLSWLFGFYALAQNQPSLSDTIHLEEVVTYGALRKYQSGAKIEKIPESQFQLSQDGNLEQLLSRTSPISLKANAGGLSTIRIRGSAPDHTSINFGGININSLTLGHSNVSNVPMYLFDNVGIQFGSSSSVNGSGSIGGAIYLGLKNNWVDGFKAEIRSANGSFGEQFYGTKIYLGNGKFESVTRAYYYYKNNDFKFINPNYRDFENGIFEIEDTQHNANIENMGLLQELNYKFAENEMFLFRVWIEKDWHLIQQNMQTNFYNPEMKEDYYDNHIRIWTGYKNRKNPFKYEINGGYVYDNATHNANTQDTIQTQRFIGESFIEHDLSFDASYKIGMKASRISPTVHAYSADLKHEDRVDFYASYFHQFLNKLKVTANLRQGFVTNFKVPFTPSVGLNYIAISKEKYVLNLSGNVARSYRVPTFNDRYWIPGGNPDLNPEKGMNYELGTKFSYCDENISGNIKANLFYMNIEDWILWKKGNLPSDGKDLEDSMGEYWYAENVQNVESKGFEIMADVQHKIWIFKTNSGINYAFTSAQRIKSLNNTNALNRQLEYVPKHSANFYTTSIYKNIGITIDGSYTDKQFTNEEEEDILASYFLLNIAGSYKILINEDNSLKISGMLNNLLNTNYQASYGFAMPGINYRISLTYNFK